ncbi:RES family NAD+ phosphorylase [Nostoc sp. CHAB 5834]|nr:RES family NAD+ phosphorylase [Nostoc sp. CHAB 5834]
MPNEASDSWHRKSLNRTWYRLIPSRFPPIQVYERIVRGDRVNEVAAIEALTSPRVRSRQRLTGLGSVDEASAKLQNWNHAPFTYLNPDGSFIFRPGIAALEVSDSLQTALAVSVNRRERFLKCTNLPKVGLDMRVLTTRISGRFVDLTNERLPDNPEDRWKLGDEFVRDGIAGILFDCPMRPGSTCLSVLDNNTLDRSVQADHFRFIWNGERISLLYSFSGPGSEIDPALLCGPQIAELR